MEKSQVPYIKPYLLATIKRFISKLRNKGVKKDIKLLSNQSLNLLNDNSYYTNEKKPKNYYYEKLKFPWFNSIDPYNHYKIVWDLLNLLIILMFILWIPIEISFQSKLPNQVYGIVVLIFSTDIALNFNTAYFHHGFITTQSSKIIKNYLFYDFFLDFITLSTIFLDFYENQHWVSSIKLLFLIRFKTLSKIYHHLIEKFRLFVRINTSFLDLINLLFLSMFILHYFACFWYLLADVSPNKLTWITHYGIENLTNIEKYFYSLYWSSVTIMTVGYGDICPQNISEMIFCIITIVFGCGLFAYIINAIGIIIGKINMENEKFNKRMNIIDKFMHRKSIDRNLQMKIREYFRFIWQEEFTQYSEKETDIINKLSKSLKEELYIEAHGPLLNKFPLFFANFTENTLKSLVFKVKEIRYSPEDIIYAENTIDDSEIFIISKGKADLVRKYSRYKSKKESMKKIQSLKENDIFGEQEFFTGSLRGLTCISKDFTAVYTIKRSDFIEILLKNSEDYEKYCMIKDQILLQNKLDSLKTRCFTCRSIGHFVYDCPLLHYIPDKEKIIKNYNQNNIHKRTKFIRRKITNQNSLKNKKKINEKSENINKFMKKNTFLKNIPTLNSVKTQISIENETDELFSNEKIHSPSVFTKNDFLINNENFQSKENFPQKKKSLKILTSPQKKDFFSQEKSPISVGVTIERKIKEVLNKNGLVEPILELDKVYNYKSYFPKGNIKQFIKNFGFDGFSLNSHLQQSKITAGFKIFNIEENDSFAKNESPVLKETNIFQTKAKIFGKKNKKKSFYDIVFEVMNNEKLFKKRKKIIKNKK